MGLAEEEFRGLPVPGIASKTLRGAGGLGEPHQALVEEASEGLRAELEDFGETPDRLLALLVAAFEFVDECALGRNVEADHKDPHHGPALARAKRMIGQAELAELTAHARVVHRKVLDRAEVQDGLPVLVGLLEDQTQPVLDHRAPVRGPGLREEGRREVAADQVFSSAEEFLREDRGAAGADLQVGSHGERDERRVGEQVARDAVGL